MKKIMMICLVMATAILILPACKDEKGCMDPTSNNYNADAEEDDGSCTYTGGLGGNVTLVASPEHHGSPIVSDSIYPDSAFIKFNASNLPGTSPSDFDLIVVGEIGEDHVHIQNLKRGKYFIYMTGWDPSLPDTVRGGIPIEITQTSGEYDVDVPVTE